MGQLALIIVGALMILVAIVFGGKKEDTNEILDLVKENQRSTMEAINKFREAGIMISQTDSRVNEIQMTSKTISDQVVALKKQTDILEARQFTLEKKNIAKEQNLILHFPEKPIPVQIIQTAPPREGHQPPKPPSNPHGSGGAGT